LALLQNNPGAKENYPQEQRRECAIEAVEVQIRQTCYWGTPVHDPLLQGCQNPRGLATTLVDEIIRLKKSGG
jgi:hypothetical protein